MIITTIVTMIMIIMMVKYDNNDDSNAFSNNDIYQNDIDASANERL